MKGRRSSWILLLIFLVGFLVVLYTVPPDNRWTYLFRSFLIVTTILLVVLPLLKRVLRKWSTQHKEVVASYWQTLPQLRQQVQAAWQVAKREKKLMTRVARFVVYSFWLTLMAE